MTEPTRQAVDRTPTQQANPLRARSQCVASRDWGVDAEVLAEEGGGAQPLPVGRVQAPAGQGRAVEEGKRHALRAAAASKCNLLHANMNTAWAQLEARLQWTPAPLCCSMACCAHQSASIRYLSNTAWPASQLQHQGHMRVKAWCMPVPDEQTQLARGERSQRGGGWCALHACAIRAHPAPVRHCSLGWAPRLAGRPGCLLTCTTGRHA